MMAMQKQTIIVDGQYKPAVVKFQQGQPAQLTFVRTSDRGCLQQVQSQSLGFKLDLALNEPQTVTIATKQAGTYDFACGMDMVHGKVVIEP